MERRRIIDGLTIATTGIALMGLSQNTNVEEPITQPELPPPAVLITPDIPLPEWNISYDVGDPIGVYMENFIVPEEFRECFSWPVYGNLSTYFGRLDDSYVFTESEKIRWGHYGIDIYGDYAEYGAPVSSPADGIIEHVELGLLGYGNYLIIDHKNGFKSLLAHHSEMLVQEGQEVKRGEVIAAIGTSGFSGGPHSHFELSYEGIMVNPLLFLQSGDLEC